MKKYCILLMIAVFFIIIVRLIIGEICVVSSSSMEPSILGGDWLWINKITYGAQLPRRWADVPLINLFTWNRYLREADEENEWAYSRFPYMQKPRIGDIIVFKSPEDTSIFLVKRITNILQQGEQITITSDNLHLLRNIIEEEYSVAVKENVVLINGKPDSLYILPHMCYYTIGDNYFHSHDSRNFGFITEKHIIGKVNIVLFSIDNQKPFLSRQRLKRIFHWIN